MSPRNRDLGLERFEYSRVGAEWAVLRLLTRLGDELGPPVEAQLMIGRGAESEGLLYPARACALERRLLGRAGRVDSGGASELLWRASFAVPLEVAECQHAVFELTAPGGLALALPSPAARMITPRQLALARARHRDQHPRIAVGQVRQRVAALATAIVVTTTSTPAVALAASSAASTPTDSGQQLPQPAGANQAPGTATTTSTASTTGSPSTTASQTGTQSAPATTPAAQSTTPPAQTATPAAQSTAPTASERSRPTATNATHGAQRTTSRPSAGTTASHGHAIAVKPANLRQKSSRHASLAHPKVIHFFSASARPARTPVAKPVKALAPCTSKTGNGALAIAATFKPTTAGRTGHLNDGTQTRCSPPAASKRSRRHEPAAKQPKRSGATFTPGGPNPVPGRRTSRAAPAKHAGHHPSPRGKHATGGAPVQPLGGLSKQPGVKLGAGTSTGSVPTLSSSPPGFLGPAAWTGTVSADPALTGAVTDLSGLLSNGDRPPSFLIPIYMQAGHRYGVPWEVLAAINAIESDYGRDLSTSSAGALGWMQFEPSTWRQYGVAADRHSVPNPYDPRDAIFSAARYLAAAGANQDVSKAVYAYNHATWYVDEVMSRAQAIATHVQFERQAVSKRGTYSVYFATGIKKHPTVRFRGGVLSHYDRLIASANMVSAANFPYLYGGGHEQPARFGPFDCSGSVSYVVQQAGYKVPTTVSGHVPVWKFPSGPGRVTIFYNPSHTFMRIGSRYFGTSGFARPAGGAGWFDVDKLPASYLAQFREVHVPRLGTNSFAPSKRLRITRF
jgi:hypothetical protein